MMRILYYTYKYGVALFIVWASWFPQAHAQGVKSDIRRANKQFNKKDYTGAEVSYRRILQKDKANPFALFGLAASQQARGLTDDALREYMSLADRPDILPLHQSALYHNMGNAMMKKESYEQAVSLYKKALLLNPSDDETRYNYTLAKKLLEKQQQNQDNNKSNNKKDQQKQAPQQNPNPDEKGDSNPSEQENPENKKDKSTQGEKQVDRGNAEQILDAYKQDEEKTRRRVEEMKKQQRNRNPQKKKQW